MAVSQPQDEAPSEPDVGHATVAAHLAGLLEVGASLRAGVSDDVLVRGLARTIAERLGFMTVAVNVYRPATGDFVVAECVGDARARRALLGSVTSFRHWAPMLPEDDAGQARFLPAGTVDWAENDRPPSYVPPVQHDGTPDGWHPEDALFVPLRATSGAWLGIVSVDEPVTGRRPSEGELAVLEAFCAHLALTLEIGRLRARDRLRGEALAQLAELSASVQRRTSREQALTDVVEAATSTLDFKEVEVVVADGVRFDVRSGGGPTRFGPLGQTDRAALESGVTQVVHAAGGTVACALRSPSGALIGTLRARGGPHGDMGDTARGDLLRAFADLAQAVVSSASYEALRLSELGKDAIVGASLDAIATVDVDGRVVEVNPAAERLFGRPARDAIGMDAVALILPPEARADGKGLSALVDGPLRPGRHQEIVALRADGSRFIAEVAVIRMEADGPAVFTAFLRDVTDRVEARRRLEQQRDAEHHAATHDALTGLPNRDGLRELAETTGPLTERTLIKIGLDSLPSIHEGFGHELANSATVSRAGQLLAAARQAGPVARTGDHTLAVLAASDEAETLAERLRAIAAEPLQFEDLTLLSAVTIGLAEGRGGDSVDDLLRRADVARHRSRTAGGVAVHYRPGDDTAEQRLRDAAALRSAIDCGELELHYQPLFSVASGELVGLEALARWRTADGSLISPAHFIPIAESTGLIAPIGEWVITEACQQSARWRALGHTPPAISVNVSPHQLGHHDVAALVAAGLQRARLEPEALCVEVTETALNIRPDAMHRLLRDLGKLGVRRALDDFGADFSSLSRLATLDVDIVKLDRSFLERVPEDHKATALFNAIAQVTQATGLQTTAEGIEREPQLDVLRRAGIDTAQGFLLGRPAPSTDIVPLLDA